MSGIKFRKKKRKKVDNIENIEKIIGRRNKKPNRWWDDWMFHIYQETLKRVVPDIS